ncbi:MAG: glycosyltransferase [Clostridium sp.]|uniref:glycosyltransferase n=1 Tax=Clostridium sp. TaxID=1506 RepID=UPI002A750DCA|nr:glycosyltransferase [Clostridium sp.]MDY2630700.1 glycosyltransferase [Clostridium sp.]
MNKEIKISVAMATYNGEKYIKEQLDSIINQLEEDDEIVICDDGSTDTTIEIIKEYIKNDNRIKLYCNNHVGVNLNFENAISKCKNDVIMLSDQDDIWEINKVKEVKMKFISSDCNMVLHNGKNFYEEKTHRNEDMLIPIMKHGVFSNVVKCCYWGCCMAFTKEFASAIIPFPKGIVAHDIWLGVIAEYIGKSEFINSNLVLHRIHDNNVTKKLSIYKKIEYRVNIIINFLKYKSTIKSKLNNIKKK